MADFMLQETKPPICQTDLSSTGLLPAGSPALRCSGGTDCIILSPAFFNVGITGAARENLDSMESYFRVLGVGKGKEPKWCCPQS